MADIKISEMTTAATLNGTEASVLSQSQGGQLVSVKATLQAIANWFAVNAEYTSALNTTDKRICGAINELKQLISLIPQFSIEVVQVLPTEDISDTTIYLVPAEDPEVGNYYEEYIHVNNTWELVGSTAVDLSDYYTKAQADGKFAVTITNTISPTTTTKKVADIKQNNVTTPVYADDADAILRQAFGEHTVTGNPVSVDAFLGLEVASECKVTMNPIQDISQGDPSPTNICPISGRNSVTVTRTGKNLIPQKYYQYNSANLFLGLEDLDKEHQKYLTEGTYTFKIYTDLSSPVLNYAEYGGQTHSTTGNAISFTVTTPNYYRFWVNKSGVLPSNIPEFQLEKNASATDYEPYQAETHTHTYASPVYGGMDDFVSGEGSVTYDTVDLGTFDWTYADASGIFYTSSPTNMGERKYGGVTALSEIYKVWTGESADFLTSDAVISVNNRYISNQNRISIRDSRYTDATSFKTAMSGVQLCYELATPTPITNTPEDISLLKGVNVVSTDGDSLELNYSADIKAYIDSRLA